MSIAHELIHTKWHFDPTGIVAGSEAVALCWRTQFSIESVLAEICFVLSGTAEAATAVDAVSGILRSLVARSVQS